MMGSGKSSIGNLVSKKLDLHFVDIDNLIKKRKRCSFPKYSKKMERIILEV